MINVLRQRRYQVGLAAVAIGAAVLAPLATSAPAAKATTIAGARSLGDNVAVNFDHGHKPAKTVDVHLLAYNDLHGTLDPASQNQYGQYAGGAAFLAKAIKDRQKKYGANEATVFAGDGIGASQLANGLFHEEPSTIIANLVHTDFASVGNHEFDKGSGELLRIQNGGCHIDGCTGAPYALANGRTSTFFPGADFQYLSANVVRDDNGKTLFPAYGIKTFHASGSGKPVKVGFIGEVLEATPTIVTPTGVAGLEFQDEAKAANKAVRDLKKQGVNVPVLVIHQGGFQDGTATLNGCAGSLAGSDIEKIAENLDPSIKVIISGHTHAEYRCTITTHGITRLITSASSFGRILSDLTLKIDTKSGQLVSASADNVLIKNSTNADTKTARVPDPALADPAVQKVVDQYVTASAPLANKVIGTVGGDLTRTATAQGESTMGDVIADAQLEATADPSVGGADIALMNVGGVRADLIANNSAGGEADGQVTYGEAFTVQPFGNSLVTKTMTGAQVRSVLEQQFGGCGGQTTARVMQISSTLKYESDPGAAACADKIGTIWIKGTEVQPTDTYRVTMNNFMATGGDGFTVFNDGTDALGGAQDIDALVDYFEAHSPLAVPALDRIVPKP